MGGVQEKSQTKELSREQLQRFTEVLAEATAILEREEAPYVAAGSLASNEWGRPSAMGDIDLVVDPRDAKRLLGAFADAGYETDETEPQWLFKASKDDVEVDFIFEMEGHLYLDEQMLDRAALKEVYGTKLRLMTPEDFIVTQAMSAKEDTPDYWYNGLGVLAKAQLDWDYLVERASVGPRRVLALMIYAQSNDLPIPDGAIKRLFETVYGR